VAVLAELWRFEKSGKDMKKKIRKKWQWVGLAVGSGVGSGSGWVAVVAIERGDECGSNGVGLNLVVAVLVELWRFEKVEDFFCKKVYMMYVRAVVGWGVAVAAWQWYHWIREIRAVILVQVSVW
jgi:hypothetical protein